MKTSRKLGSLAGAALALTLLAFPAAAQRSDDMKDQGQHPCAGDAQRLCSAAIPDKGKVASCLSKNKSQLSSACRAFFGGNKATRHGKRHGKSHGRRHHRR
jgi:hypothetical protein